MILPIWKYVLYLVVSVSITQAGPRLSCVFDEQDFSNVCGPCNRKELWLKLIKPEGGGPEKITDDGKTCFNNDPITVQGGSDVTGGGDDMRIISQGEFRLSKGAKKPFAISKIGFFRYSYTGDGSSESEETETYLDIGATKKYFHHMDTSGSRMFADFQLIEWPGKTSSMLKKSIEKEMEGMRLKECSQEFPESPDCQFPKVWMLQLERENGKIVHYPCNQVAGTYVVAVAGIRKNDEGTKENIQKIWLSHGRQSIYSNYIQPLVVPQDILLKMAKSKDSGNTRCIDDTEENKEDPLLDLRTVYDFTFTRHRLLVAMKCGILIISSLLREDVIIRPANLLTESGYGPNLFPEGINHISADVCCSNTYRCSEDYGIAAAYYYNPSRPVGEDRFMYVSFDLGETYEKKIIATPYSPVNLINGLYKLYEKWHDYYEILHNPDKKDLEEDDKFMENIRHKVTWEIGSTAAKEKLFRVGSSRLERRKASLKRIAQILEERVPERKKRLGRKDKNDKTPQWVKLLMRERRKAVGWQDEWTEENCMSIPECAEKFENDKAVDWLLKDADIHVLTPKRNESHPFCKDIVSLLVISEENNIMALCEVGFGKVEDEEGAVTGSGLGGGGGGRRASGRQGTGEDEGVNATVDGAGVEETTIGTGEVGNESKNTTGPSGAKEEDGSDVGFFAIYNFPLKQNIPMIYGYRVSERIFTCKYIINDVDPANKVKVRPIIIRIPGSGIVFVSNCDGILYLSTNFGKTLFNAVFYYEKKLIHDYCKQGGESTKTEEPEPCFPDDEESSNDLEGDKSQHFLRSFNLCALNVPPLITVDTSATVLLITFGKFFARGAIAYNREARLVVGAALRDIPYDRRFDNLIFPAHNENGEAMVTVALRHVYSVPDTVFKTELYKEKHALRLIPTILQFFQLARHFYEESLSMCPYASERKLGFPSCKTISFSVHPKHLEMDIGDNATVNVRVKDDDPNLPLWVFASNSKCVDVETKLLSQFSYNVRRDADEYVDFNQHEWDVEIKTKANEKNKDELEARVDAFYGSSYNVLRESSTQITLVNSPTIRCHVQPSATVHVDITCKGKKIAAHEDIHRPQCREFRRNFNYTLKKGTYDPDVANYWLTSEIHQKRPFVRLQSNGDLVVTYDYSNWGCPLEPFGSDAFIPDLRVLDRTAGKDTSTARKFEGEFILIELFGAKGFHYVKKVRDVMGKTCNIVPQNLKDLIQRWKFRERVFQLASNRMKFPLKSEIERDSFNFSTQIGGSRLFENEAVKEHVNIWNRANYQNCFDPDLEGSSFPISDDILDREYELMRTPTFNKDDEIDVENQYVEKDAYLYGGEEAAEDRAKEEVELNMIEWDKGQHQRIYVFLAVAVDKYDSFCTYQTIFGVSLKTTKDMDDLTSFVVFLFFVFMWLFLIFGGYFFRRRLLRLSFIRQARAERLEQAAWMIIYRYEKLIHGNAINAMLRPDQQKDPTKMRTIHKNMHEKRFAEMRMKKTHILAQEQAKHEKLQKMFEKE